MRVTMRDSHSPIAPPVLASPIVLTGAPVDQRGKEACSHVASFGARTMRMHYDPKTIEVSIDGVAVPMDDLALKLIAFGGRELVLEATSLSFAELFVAAYAARSAGISRIIFVYVEPAHYSKPQRSGSSHVREFDLTTEIPGFIGIPGRSQPLDHGRKQRVLFLVGYEGDRLDRAFETLNLEPRTCGVVFGVPAFSAGWEMNTFSNVAPIMNERRIDGGVFFCAADNPVAVFELLQREYKVHAGNHIDFFVSPIGTKPHGIGALLFLLENEDVGLLYDHPEPKKGRTEDLLTWHQFDASW
jgi:hypothetical protein